MTSASALYILYRQMAVTAESDLSPVLWIDVQVTELPDDGVRMVGLVARLLQQLQVVGDLRPLGLTTELG